MYLSKLYPKPAFCKEEESIRYSFGANETLYVTKPLTAAVAERLQYLWHRFTCTASALTIVVKEDAAPSVTAWLGEKTAFSADYYGIRANERGVTVTAVDEKAFIDGYSTLMQLICPVNLEEGEESFYIAAAQVDDQPTIGFRSVHFCVFPESKIETLEKAIHLAGFLKFTHIVLEFWGILELQSAPWMMWDGYGWSKAKAKILIDLAKSYGMEVIPMFNHVGHASGCRVGFGRHAALNRDLRLSKYFEPDGWTWCSSNPKTRALLRDIRLEMMELCGEGSYFHIGADEAYSFASCDVCRKREPHVLFAEYLNGITEDLAQYGRRPIMWHDELINRSNFTGYTDYIEANGESHGTAPAINLLDRRMIIADWQYSYVSGQNPTTPYFMEKGFDTVLCPWDNWKNIQCLTDGARSFGAYGVMLTTWDHLPDYLRKFIMASGFTWRGDNTYSTTDAAAILRDLYDTKGDFLTSGWHKWEVNE